MIPLRGKPKARPRVTRNGTFMPKDYQSWREAFGMLMTTGRNPAPQLGDLPIALELEFGTEAVKVSLFEQPTAKRAKHVRADVDNLIGAVMEVLEDQGIVTNDRQVMLVVASVAEEQT